jgi:hypothetical protein
LFFEWNMVHDNSKKTYREELKNFSDRAYDIYIYALEQGKALTDREIMEALDFKEPNAVRPRITELIQDGWMKEVGNVICTVTEKRVRQVKAIHPDNRVAPEEEEGATQFFIVVYELNGQRKRGVRDTLEEAEATPNFKEIYRVKGHVVKRESADPRD